MSSLGPYPVVLVVEDEQNARENLCELLELEGFEVYSAGHGRDALAKLDLIGARACTVLLDLVMPVMNGWQLIEHLRATERLAGLEVIITSSAVDRAPVGISVLQKPLDPEKLLAMLKRPARAR